MADSPASTDGAGRTPEAIRIEFLEEAVRRSHAEALDATDNMVAARRENNALRERTRVLEEANGRLREEIEGAADTLCDIVTGQPDWTAHQSTIDAELKRMHESFRAALRSGEGGRHEG